MDDLLDMIASGESSSEISDKIKDLLFTKSAEKIDNFRPVVAQSLFGDQGYSEENDDEDEKES